MITEEQAKIIGDKYLKDNNIEYSSIYPKIGFHKEDEILYGKKEGEILDVYSYHFAQLWGIEERGFVLFIEAKTGNPLYVMTPHGYWDI